jgi:hypothetical protein
MPRSRVNGCGAEYNPVVRLGRTRKRHFSLTAQIWEGL